MDRIRRVIISLTFLLTLAGVAAADGSAEAVSSALERQNVWLGESSKAEGWRNYLQTEQLQELLEAPSIDHRVLAAILGRYNSQAAGLERGPFVATRNALTQLADELEVPLALRWAEQARTTAPYQRAFTEADLANARLQAQGAKQRLHEYLSSADAGTTDGWKSFLRWDDLEAGLESDAPDSQQLDQVVKRFYNGYPGLEFPTFVEVRESLRKYFYLVRLSETGDTGQSAKRYANSLATALDQYNEAPTTKHAADAAAIAEWLSGLDRDYGLSSQLHSAHARPNVRIRISEQLVARRFSQSVNDNMPVNEMILGTHVRGTAVTQGTITTDIVPNPNAAQINIIFSGTSTTQSVGRQKPVTICSTSVANLGACKPLYLYPSDVQSAPAQAHGVVNTTIHSITPDNRLGRGLVKKIAWKRAMQQKPKSERITAERTSRRLSSKIDEQTQELLNNARAQLREQIQGPINRRGLIPEDISTSSSDSHVLVFAKQAGRGQLASMTEPPVFDRGNDVVAQVHESAINNTAEKAIAGLTLTDERIAELVEELTGEVPEELRINDDDQPWSISFDWNQPVTVEFDEERMRISVRGRRFTSGERVLNKVMEMSATYSMETVPDKGVILNRQGEVEVSFPRSKNDNQISPSERVFKVLMQRKFSELFKPVIEGDGFTLPGRFSELGRIRLNELSTQGGWLSLGWK